jgi:uncharacterized protein (DUF1015 family)
MPVIVPFRGVRYDSTVAGPLPQLIAPPYDVISPQQRDQLAARNQFNIVHLELDKERAGDSKAESKYTRAAAAWKAWQEKGALKRDPQPAIYAMEQSFVAPDGRHLTRRGVIVACKLHPFKEGIVVPHEKTLSAPKADRMEIISNTKANLSPIFGLFQDEKNDALAALSRIWNMEHTAHAESDDGVYHRIWKIEDKGLIQAVQATLADRRVFIADGHHRYETALAYRDQIDAQTPGLPENGGHKFVMMFLCSMSDPGLVIFPTHRLLFDLKGIEMRSLLPILDRFFTIDTIDEDIRAPVGRAWAVSKLSEHGGKSTAFLMISAEDQKARILTLRDDAELTNAAVPKNQTVRALDVSVLHGLIFQHVLALSPKSQENQENVKYVKDTGEAVSKVLSGEYQLGFLLNPTPMWQVRAVGDAGETMPQRAPSFTPSWRAVC